MLRRGSGHIVNVASVTGLMVFHQYNAPYNVSKYGAVGFTEELMLEASVHGIGVTCVCPGGVKTAIYDTAVFKGFGEGAREELKKLLLASAEEPEDTARALVKAVKENKFLVVTTPVAKGAYFLKRHFSFAWYPLMRLTARWVYRRFGRYRTQ
jgi:short-subunit dehydrogenase